MKKTLFLFALLIPLLTNSAAAQFEIGASYEIRDDEPTSGFGLRVQKGILGKLPFVDLGLRAHFSYFSEENSASTSGVTYSQDFTNYDFGLALVGGISVGLAEPYVGLGLGSETTDIERSDVQGVSDEEESNIYWNGLVGAKVSVLPLVKPFIEYRYSNNSLSEPDVADLQNGRIMFGVVVSF